MRDDEIIDLYWERKESAISESARQYGGYCYSIAYGILNNKENSDECVNDTWMKAWKAIPPHRPGRLSLFLGRITRNLSFDKFRAGKTQKRGGGEITLVLEELDECVPSAGSVEQTVADGELSRLVNRFLHTLPERECNIFLVRYWYGRPLAEIAERFAIKENNVKASLFRSRVKLRTYLEKEGVHL